MPGKMVREERLRRERAEADHRQREEQRQAELAQREAAVQAEVARQQTSRQALLAQQQAERARREAAELAQKEAERCAEIVRRAEHAQRSRQEAAHTIQRLVLGTTLVTYGAGITIRNIVTGFESCRIRIKGLPADAHEKEILELFTQQGIDADRLLLVSQEPDEGRLEATVVSTMEEGSAVAIGLQGIEFREEHLDFEICDNATGMGISMSEESDTVTLSWRAPSNTFVAIFASQAIAVAKVRSLSRYICGGRRVNAELHGLDGRAVKFSGIPLFISRHTFAEFVGCEVSRLRLLATIAYVPTNGLQQVEEEIRLVFRADIHSVAASSPADGDIHADITFKARCRSREAAKRVQEYFDRKKLAYFGDQFIHAHLPHLHEATLSISSQQYRAQRRLWDALAGPETPKAATVRIFPSSHDQMQIRVWGDDKHAVGSLKVRVESVAGGEALPRDLWHRSFAAAVSPFINSIFDATGVYARADWKLCVVKLYSGDPAAIEHARQMVREELERLNASEWTFYLERQSIQFFVQGGMKTLRQILGAGNVSLDISGRTAKLHVRGGEDAHQVVDWLIAESLENVQPRTTDGTHCPICHDEVVHPVLLGCNHSYCLDCFRHYISTAADALPLNCLGNEATCNVPIALPVIERFLSPAHFQELLETAYRRYIEQHPVEFKYCKTADFCPACDEEGHEGMSCDDRRLQNDPGEQERRNVVWAVQNGIKRCPACSVWLEKTEGCNHMTCKCGAHICWICVRQFQEATIYEHLQAAHGGVFDVPAEPA
ncbi:RBR-type E3 ubiquitin transferase [Mycena chlorophos]|uniref:RBR-type E3 ubiquitin transferase n=1 Tax=Mycena chlorophos TaxID=658473 RepID=A0A8H6TQ75_MYCCL|nr:RBR-type E3 ubiquitin transferase [Mycena chlorophos]